MSANKINKKKFFVGFLFCILIIISHPIWMPLPARLLMVKDNINKADAIIVLSGDWNFEREAAAIELYKKGNADRIIRILEKENIAFDIMKRLLNTEATQRELYMRYFESKGLSREGLILGDEAATSTFDELKAAKEMVLKLHFKSIMLVTSDYHMRRALITAKWIFRSRDIKIYNATVYTKYFNPSNWWLRERSIKEVILEYLNTGFYLLYHFILGK